MKQVAVIGLMFCLMLMLVKNLCAEEEPPEAPQTSETPAVRVGNLKYGQGKSGVCFADDFLVVAGREMEMKIDPTFHPVRLDSDSLFDFPFVVMSGEGAFECSDEQITNLRDYLDRGGLLLASAGCSNVKWSKSFETLMEKVYPDSTFEPLDMEHPLFHMVYDIDRIDVKKSQNLMPQALFGLTVDHTGENFRGGRMRVVYSPLGLNDTANAGEGCCCCGGNEIRNARDINVNILAYALTH